MSLSLQFLGAAETVTGSRYLLTTASSRILVDCGLFQGYKKLRERNWAKLPFDASTIDAVVLTHAHIDHSGYLPRLRQLGFTGPIYCTEGTRDLLQVLLPDCGHIQEEDARRANRYGYTKHNPAQPLYTRLDAEVSLQQLNTKPFASTFRVTPDIEAHFTRAGHIVGSASLQLTIAGRTITFTGDLGRPVDPIMKPADHLPQSEYLITESTYGDRLHPEQDILQELGDVVRQAAQKKGVLLVPSFAVGRAQHLLHLLAELKSQKKIPDLPIYLDSPMAINATEIFLHNTLEHRLSPQECSRMSKGVSYCSTPQESKALDETGSPMILISASGMATGGRVLHHLRCFLPDSKNTVLFVGYQAGGTRGRTLVDGASEVKIHGQYIPVRANVVQVRGLSAHADYREMIQLFSESQLKPKRVFVTHGEPAAADAFRRRLRDELGYDAMVPEDGQLWTLD